MRASLAAYLAEDAESVMKGALYAPYHQYTLQGRSTVKTQTTPTPTPFTLFTRRLLKEDEVRYDGEISRIVDAGSQDIAQDRAEELGKVALLEDFGLTKEAFEAEGITGLRHAVSAPQWTANMGSGLVYPCLCKRYRMELLCSTGCADG